MTEFQNLLFLLSRAYPMLGNEPSSEAELQDLIFLKEEIKFTLDSYNGITLIVETIV